MRKILSKIWLFLWRWKVSQAEVLPDRCVMIAAPHTSNWDFPMTLAIAGATGNEIRWLGKSQMFVPVIAPIFRWLGGTSVERSSAHGLVGDLVAEFGRRSELILVVPAEATRSPVEYWKSGFYQIAMQAQVPIVCAFVDKKTRTGGYGPFIMPTGDQTKDMDLIRAFYADKSGIKPNRFNTPRLREEDALAAGSVTPEDSSSTD